MGSREEILAALRSVKLDQTELPDLHGDWISYEDPWAQFAEVLVSVGGTCVMCDSEDDFRKKLSENELFTSAQTIVSLVDGIASKGCDIHALEDPHELQHVEFAIIPGEFAVAENAAIWIQGSRLVHRSVLFLTQHKAIVVKHSTLVDQMHQAYARIKIEGERFGVFVSGPSKTADIEQSLVIGAHGSRSLTVYVVKD